MAYEVIIGLEVHAQLLTQSKMFCGCSAAYQDAPPNTHVCEICLGMPGVLPSINRRAVEYVIATGLALNCEITNETKFDRKNYPYPDLMKGYQISQYDMPIAIRGYLDCQVNGTEKHIGITRVHLEEDVAKLLHRNGSGESYSLMDVNRSGVPLMEIVSDPDMRTPEEARAYLMQLRSILRYIGVSTANMEEGSFRCDANISIRPMGSTEYGPKVEVKNMNSFRSVFNALAYEAKRQVQAVEDGQVIHQETRGWDDARGVTVPQRSKEFASDYRYFPEPDLPPLRIEQAWVAKVRSDLPELPQARKARFVNELGLPSYDAGLLTATKPVADYFEAILEAKGITGEKSEQYAKTVSNWVLGELTRLMNTTGTEIDNIKIHPKEFFELLDLVESGALTTGMARTVFEEMFNTGASAKSIAEKSGMVQVRDEDVIRAAVVEAIKANPKPVADYLSGKDTAMRFLVGQVMKMTKGKANPGIVTELVKGALEALR